MRIFLTGPSCVWKTTIGWELSELLGVDFFDLDQEIETFLGTSIERLQDRFLTMYSFRDEAAKALVHLLARPDSRGSVIALPPSGLMGGYLRAVKKSPGVIVVLNDKPENILARTTFFDIDSQPIEKDLSSEEKRLYLREIRKDKTYFRKTYKRAHLQIDISGLDVVDAARKVKEAVRAFAGEPSEGGKSQQPGGHQP